MKQIYKHPRYSFGFFGLIGCPSSQNPRLAILFILKQKAQDCISWFGLKCSSLCAMNRGTSERSACNSTGNPAKPSVASSNMMIERNFDLDVFFLFVDDVRLKYGNLWALGSSKNTDCISSMKVCWVTIAGLKPVCKPKLWGTLMWHPCVAYLGLYVFRCYPRFAPEFGL